MDKTQIQFYNKAIKKVQEHNEKAFFGIIYGKPDGNYISTSILETYMEKWSVKSLIDKDLWDYTSGNESYQEFLMNTIQEAAEEFLGDESLIEKKDDKIEILLSEFETKYGSMEYFYNSLW